MKTIKKIRADRRYTNPELAARLAASPSFALRPQIVGRKRGERIIFPETQDGPYVVSVKCSKNIRVYLGEYVAPNPKRAVYDSYYSDITYWGDAKKRKNLYDKISGTAEQIRSLLGATIEEDEEDGGE